MRDWAFFSNLIGNVEMTLAKTDLRIAATYVSALVEPAQQTVRAVREEHELTLRELLALTGGSAAGPAPGAAQHARVRDAYLEPLHHLQVELLAQRRAAEEPDPGPGARPPADDQRHRGGDEEHRLTRPVGGPHPRAARTGQPGGGRPANVARPAEPLEQPDDLGGDVELPRGRRRAGPRWGRRGAGCARTRPCSGSRAATRWSTGRGCATRARRPGGRSSSWTTPRGRSARRAPARPRRTPCRPPTSSS